MFVECVSECVCMWGEYKLMAVVFFFLFMTSHTALLFSMVCLEGVQTFALHTKGNDNEQFFFFFSTNELPFLHELPFRFINIVYVEEGDLLALL